MKMMFVLTAVILSTSLVLGDFQQDLFTEYCKNETLKLNYGFINDIPKEFIILPSLKCISLAYSHIEYIKEGAFDGVPNLMHLNLENNAIKPSNLFSFGSLPNVRSLILGNQGQNFMTYPHYVPGYDPGYDPGYLINNNHTVEVNTVYPELLHLNLSNDNINSIKTNVSNPFPKLTHLDLSNNNLFSFDSQSWSNTLMYLNLNYNQISNIAFKELKNLISLTVDNNMISTVGKDYDLDLSGLSNLEYLSISKNSIREINVEAFADLVNLRRLDMSESKLTALDSRVFTPLTSLEVIILNNNMFDTIPLNVPLNITTLLMDCNRITDLTASSLSMLSNLRKLSLARNMISSIHVDTFKSQELLEELYLNDNELNHLPLHWYLHTKNLRHLDLSGNKFTSIASFLSTTNIALGQVYLADNPLKYVGVINRAIPENMTIYLNFGQERLIPVCTPSYLYSFV